MKTNVRETSIAAYQAGDFTPQAWDIFKFLAKHPRQTRREIATDLGLDVSSVAGRINELIKEGVVSESGKRPCSITGRAAFSLDIINKRSNP